MSVITSQDFRDALAAYREARARYFADRPIDEPEGALDRDGEAEHDAAMNLAAARPDGLEDARALLEVVLTRLSWSIEAYGHRRPPEDIADFNSEAVDGRIDDAVTYCMARRVLDALAGGRP